MDPIIPSNTFMAREAIASVSLSHADKCTCNVCKAAQGDEDAMSEILAALGERQS